ncbi:MAG TPA: efflux RND transporter periplasmic adaptor subunit [Gemmataceae bacterium]|nr:efflux RND transporter periplasmic adaptor subunit [Gemmataceae bacterium]
MNVSSLHHSAASPRRNGRRWRLLGFGTLAPLLAVVLAAGCNQAPPPARDKTVEVEVTTPVSGRVADYQDFTGRLDGLKTVSIRARVTGFITKAPFKEGDLVEEGKVLFEIDRRQYEANLNQSKANLKQAIADRNLQEKLANRARGLRSNDSIAQEEYETIVATYEKSRATVGSVQAARDLNELYLYWTRVTAPLSGRISRRNVDPGNLVNADNTILTTIVSDSQLYAYFDVDERTYMDLRESTTAGQSSWFSGLQFPVLMRLVNEDDFSRSGTVNFIDNRVSGSTGTIRMRGVFDNPAGILRAGLFVRIRLPIGKPYSTLLIPDEALLSDQGRSYVYVVNKNHEVAYRPVTVGQAIGGLRAIKAAEKGKDGKEGLSPGELVIVSGMQRVRPGAQVEYKKQAPPKPPDSPLVRLLTPKRPAPAASKPARAG